MKYLFGPVNSRRLGISLGIDLVKHKTCTLDCIYCECGPTTDFVKDIIEYVPLNEVIDEIDDFLKPGPELDYITFSGSGEPTLHSGLGDIISFIKSNYDKYKIAVLTNGTLLNKIQVRYALKKADIVMPSLDAVSQDVFEKILRPVAGLTPEKHIQGLLDFRKEFKGKMILEIFIVPGINDTDDELAKIKSVSMMINPDEIQLNSLDRPGTEREIKTLDKKRLYEIIEFLKPLPVMKIEEASGKVKNDYEHSELINTIIATIKRRPSTIDDLHRTLGIKPDDLIPIIKIMLNSGTIKEETLERGSFFRLS